MISEPTWVTKRRATSIGVEAGPLGFRGRVRDLWLGPTRSTKEEALADAYFADECIENTPLGVLV